MFDKEDFDRLADYVDYFSLMTYDYSSVQRPGIIFISELSQFNTAKRFVWYIQFFVSLQQYINFSLSILTINFIIRSKQSIALDEIMC